MTVSGIAIGLISFGISLALSYQLIWNGDSNPLYKTFVSGDVDALDLSVGGSAIVFELDVSEFQKQATKHQESLAASAAVLFGSSSLDIFSQVRAVARGVSIARAVTGLNTGYSPPDKFLFAGVGVWIGAWLVVSLVTAPVILMFRFLAVCSGGKPQFAYYPPPTIAVAFGLLALRVMCWRTATEAYSATFQWAIAYCVADVVLNAVRDWLAVREWKSARVRTSEHSD